MRSASANYFLSMSSLLEQCRRAFEGVRFERPLETGRLPSGTAETSMRDCLVAAGCVELLRAAGAAATPLTVVVNDPHRATATRPFIEALCGLADESGRPAMRLLVAAGSHRSDRDERRRHEEAVCGPLRARFAPVEWHDADDPTGLAEVGGFRFHRWMAERGFYLACGSLEPHYFAGVTGAHKTLTVGVMSREQIEANHAGAMSANAAPLRLHGNPVHEGIVSALRALEDSGASLLAVDEVVVNGEVAALTAGDPLQALEDGLPFVREAFVHRVVEPVDVLVARIEPPLDRDLYQADKGIKNTEGAVCEGGVLVVDATCEKGVGIDHFIDLLRAASTHREALAIVESRGYRLGDHKAVRLRALTDTRGVRIGLVSPNIDPALGAVLGMQVFSSLDAASRWAAALLPPHATGLAVEDAGNVALEIG